MRTNGQYPISSPSSSYTIVSIIFSFWTTTLDLVADAMDAIGMKYTRVDGKMPIKQRQEALDSMTRDVQTRVLLMSLRCGSNG